MMGFLLHKKYCFLLCTTCKLAVAYEDAYSHCQEHQKIDKSMRKVTLPERGVFEAEAQSLGVAEYTDFKLPPNGEPPLGFLDVTEALKCLICGYVAKEDTMRKHFGKKCSMPALQKKGPHPEITAKFSSLIGLGYLQTVKAQCIFHNLARRNYFHVVMPPKAPAPDLSRESLVQTLKANLKNAQSNSGIVADTRDRTAFNKLMGWVRLVDVDDVAELHSMISNSGRNDEETARCVISLTTKYYEGINETLQRRRIEPVLLGLLRPEHG